MAAISSSPATTALAPSALSRLCGGIMEAVWLTAVAALPSLFNPYSQDNFGPEKQRLLHILGLTMAAAWIVRSVEERLALGEAKTRLWKLFQRPAAWFLAALTLSYIAAACLSVEPARSWWGDFQGSGFATCTFLSHLVLLAAMAAHLRDRDQVERFATAVLVGSVPVCLYGLLQRAGFDPIKWSWGRDEISSLLGHQIYVAAYLGMVFPLCLRRIIQIARDLRTESGGNTQKTGTSRPRGIPVRSAAQPKPGVETTRRLKIAALGVYCLLAILQLGTFVLAEKRGPLLGLLASLVSFFALLSVCWGLRRLLRWTIAAGGAAGILLVLLNISGGPLERLRSVPVLKEFSHGLFSTHDASGYFRANLWKECPALMLSGDALRRPDGSADGLHALRRWLGYGPDTTTGVLAQRFTVPHSAATLEDHFHNLAWELWETIGGFGVVSFLGFFTSLIYSGLRRLGLIAGRADRIMFWFVSVVAALSGATVLCLWQGAGFCGLGLQIGMAAGCGVYRLIKVPRQQNLWVNSPGSGSLPNV